MNKEQYILNLLGLATRARKVTLGEDFVIKEIQKNNPCIVFLANDSGDNIKKKINNKVNTYNATLVETFSTEELSKAIGKDNRKVVLVSDKGFTKKFLEYLNS